MYISVCVCMAARLLHIEMRVLYIHTYTRTHTQNVVSHLWSRKHRHTFWEEDANKRTPAEALHRSVCLLIYFCLSVYLSIFVCLSIYLSIYLAHIHACTLGFLHIQAHTITLTLMQSLCMHQKSLPPNSKHRLLAYMHAYIHTYSHTQIKDFQQLTNTCIHTHKHTRTYIHTHTSKYTMTYLEILSRVRAVFNGSETGMFGLGTHRTLTAYEMFANISISRGQVGERARTGESL